MKTLLYGGTFDPPHNGHMNNLRAALALVQPDRALVMPAGTPPHKHASATPAELRLQMCACFTALSPAVQVSDWEIRRGGRSYTVHTLEWLRGQDPDGALYLCVGSDMLLTFQEWYRWQDMLKMAALVVESRTGTDEAALHAAAAELKKAGLWDYGVGAAITLVPMLVAVCVGLFVFKINILDLLGTITGGMTSTPGLAAADSMTDSNIPSVAYATVYPIAMVFLILIIQVIASAVY